MMWLVAEASQWILRCARTFSQLIFSLMLHDWWDDFSQCRWIKSLKRNESNSELFVGEERECSSVVKLVTWSQPNNVQFGYWRQKLGLKTTHEQSSAEGGCSDGHCKHHQWGHSEFGDVHGLQMSGPHWLERIVIEAIKTMVTFTVMLVCLNIFQPMKMGLLCMKWLIYKQLQCHCRLFLKTPTLNLKVYNSFIFWLCYVKSIVVV